MKNKIIKLGLTLIVTFIVFFFFENILFDQDKPLGNLIIQAVIVGISIFFFMLLLEKRSQKP